MKHTKGKWEVKIYQYDNYKGIYHIDKINHNKGEIVDFAIITDSIEAHKKYYLFCDSLKQ